MVYDPKDKTNKQTSMGYSEGKYILAVHTLEVRLKFRASYKGDQMPTQTGMALCEVASDAIPCGGQTRGKCVTKM